MDIRRYYIPDTIYFITSVTHNRKPVFHSPINIRIFFDTLSNAKIHYPHDLQAHVLLPDHFHFLIKPKDCTISQIMQSLKRNVTLNVKKYQNLRGNVTLWQHRFYDHVIRNDADYEKHFHYIHYNPIKHGLVDKPEDWDNFVITEEDYVEFLSRMTTGSAIPALFYSYFRKRSFLFLGYSLNDWNFRVVLKNLDNLPGRRREGDSKGSRSVKSWAIQDKPSELERRLWRYRGVEIFDKTLDEFLSDYNEETEEENE